jgi:hypothetical protein
MLLSPPADREAHCSDAVNAVIIGMFSSHRISTLSQTLKLLDYEKEKKKREIESGEQSEDHCIHCIHCISAASPSTASEAIAAAAAVQLAMRAQDWRALARVSPRIYS